WREQLGSRLRPPVLCRAWARTTERPGSGAATPKHATEPRAGTTRCWIPSPPRATVAQGAVDHRASNPLVDAGGATRPASFGEASRRARSLRFARLESPAGRPGANPDRSSAVHDSTSRLPGPNRLESIPQSRVNGAPAVLPG